TATNGRGGRRGASNSPDREAFDRGPRPRGKDPGRLQANRRAIMARPGARSPRALGRPRGPTAAYRDRRRSRRRLADAGSQSEPGSNVLEAIAPFRSRLPGGTFAPAAAKEMSPAPPARSRPAGGTYPRALLVSRFIAGRHESVMTLSREGDSGSGK